MLWITRSHVHVDRVACPWLITRFIDSDADFLFVPAIQIEKAVNETGGIPFDAPVWNWVMIKRATARLKRSSSNTVLKNLACCVWQRSFMRPMFSEDIDKDPIARGLEAIATGFSLRFPEDDENLAYQFEVYMARCMPGAGCR
jgi:hypothetical protein